MFMNFYRKSAGVLQDVQRFLQDVLKWDFGAWVSEVRRMSGYGGRIGV